MEQWEVFHGIWRLTSGRVQAYPHYRFTIMGSDGSDGSYLVTQTQPVQIVVSGAEWGIKLEHRLPTMIEWTTEPARRIDSFNAIRGCLAADLNSYRLIGGTTYFGIQVVCFSEDPEIAVSPPTPPFDFTIPGQG
jgi:hypothetical protein